MKIVGHCPTCGNPIYGPKMVEATGPDVIVRRSCSCVAWARGPFQPAPPPTVYPTPPMQPYVRAQTVCQGSANAFGIGFLSSTQQRPPDEDDAFVAA